MVQQYITVDGAGFESHCCGADHDLRRSLVGGNLAHPTIISILVCKLKTTPCTARRYCGQRKIAGPVQGQASFVMIEQRLSARTRKGNLEGWNW